MLSNWRKADIMELDSETIRVILAIQREEYEKWGRWPTVQEVRALLMGR